jgi:hypothetical protein
VTAPNYGKSPLIASANFNQQWEKFIVTPNPDGTVTLESQANWNFVCADNAGTSPLIANRVTTSGWESFRINYTFIQSGSLGST